jgi:hypothetical protein
MKRWTILGICIAVIAMPLTAGTKAPWRDGFGAERSGTIPKPVRKFVIDAQACAHFSGELSGQDKKRERQVRKMVKKNCGNLDIRRDKLLTKYHGNAEIAAIIAEIWEPFL